VSYRDILTGRGWRRLCVSPFELSAADAIAALGGPDERIPCRVTADVFASGLVEVRAVVDEDGREQVIGDDEEDRIAPRESSYV